MLNSLSVKRLNVRGQVRPGVYYFNEVASATVAPHLEGIHTKDPYKHLYLMISGL